MHEQVQQMNVSGPNDKLETLKCSWKPFSVHVYFKCLPGPTLINAYLCFHFMISFLLKTGSHRGEVTQESLLLWQNGKRFQQIILFYDNILAGHFIQFGGTRFSSWMRAHEQDIDIDSFMGVDSLCLISGFTSFEELRLWKVLFAKDYTANVKRYFDARENYAVGSCLYIVDI